MRDRTQGLWFLLPVAVLLAVHGWGLAAWFQQDDFAWLGLARDWGEGAGLRELLFRPSQHGTWRPLSERAYFLFFPTLFGWESWPMRVWAFLTQAASLVLLQAIALRLGLPRVVAVMAAADRNPRILTKCCAGRRKISAA